MPQQTRSRGRVERILEVTAELVVADGVESINTRSIAAAAEIPVASLYQYFGDKEQILLALVQRDVAELEAQVNRDLGRLEVLSVRSIVETTIRAFVKVYHRNPSLVVIFMRGRTIPAIRDFCRRHNQQMARELLTGRTPRWPYLEFEIVSIRYSAREIVPGGKATPWRHFNNVGFVIVFRPEYRKA